MIKTRSTQAMRTGLVIAIFACALLAAAAIPPAAPPAHADLPPRPTKPGPTKPEEKAPGATLKLQVVFDADWPWPDAPWQELWTVAQWQDPEGDWHDVQGWQGTLDGVGSKGEQVIGYKGWWVGVEHLGGGPFRWQIYQGQGGWLLATSDPFDLPAAVKQVTVVEITLVP